MHLDVGSVIYFDSGLSTNYCGHQFSKLEIRLEASKLDKWIPSWQYPHRIAKSMHCFAVGKNLHRLQVAKIPLQLPIWKKYALTSC